MNAPKLFAVLLSIFLVAFALSCGDTSTEPNDGDDGDEEEEQSPHPFDDYPHPDGAYWIMGDDTGGWRGMIDGTSTHNSAGEVQNLDIYLNENYEGWEYEDTEYLLISANEARIYKSLNNPKSELWLKFPLNEGDTWVYKTEGQEEYTAEVLAIEDVTVDLGTFEDCYKVKYEDWAGENDRSVTVWHHWAVGGKYGVKAYFTSPEDTRILTDYSLPRK